MTKLHRCPKCGRSHTGFMDNCAECLNPTPEGALVIADETVTEFLTGRPNNVTPVTKRGRPRQFRNNAEKQKAYRQRQGGRQ